MKQFRSVAIPVLTWCALAGPVLAQSTAIVPDGTGSALNLGTTATRAGSVTTIDGGSLRGTNLFHSFSNFQLGSGDTARWVTTLANPASITSVINRVTGGTASTIQGTLNSTALPNASFFFINPAGIVFGAGARVNVPAAAYFSTAQQLRFADGASFSTTTAGGSTLSVASPQAFGFLGGQGDITLNNAGTIVNSTGTFLSLDAANVTATRSALYAAQLTIFAVGNTSAALPLAASAQLTGYSGAATFSASDLTVSFAAGGDGIVVAGGRLSMDNSNLQSSAAAGGTGGTIRIGADSLAMTNGSSLFAYTSTSGRSGSVAVSGNNISLDNAAMASASTNCSNLSCVSSGEGGNVTLNANALSMRNGAYINTFTLTSGNSGNVGVNVSTLGMSNRAYILSDTEGPGDGGRVDINAIGTVSLAGGSYIQSSGCNYTNCTDANGNQIASGNLKDIALIAGSIDLTSSSIFMDNVGPGHGGNVTIITDDLSLRGSKIGENSFFGGHNGIVDIIASGSLSLDSSDIKADGSAINLAPGPSAALNITAGNLYVKNGSSITTSFGGYLFNSVYSGNSGDIKGNDNIDINVINGGSLYLEGDSTIAPHANDFFDNPVRGVQTFLDISAQNIYMKSSQIGFIAGDSFEPIDEPIATIVNISTPPSGSISLDNSKIIAWGGNSANSGKIDIAAGRLSLVSGSGIYGTVAYALNQPNIYINILGNGLLFLDNSSISGAQAQVGVIIKGCCQSTGSNIDIIAGDVALVNGSSIISNSSVNFGDTISIAQLIAGNISVETRGNGSISMDRSTISGAVPFDAGTDDFEQAGNIALNSKNIKLNGSSIDATSFDGSINGIVGGGISIDGGQAGQLTLSSGSTISVAIHSAENFCFTECLGNSVGGNININTNLVTLAEGSAIRSDTDSSAPGGNIGITTSSTGLISVGSHSLISSNSYPTVDVVSFPTGDAGSVRLYSGLVSVTNGGSIQSTSTSPGNAGSISLIARGVVVDGFGASIATENQFDPADYGSLQVDGTAIGVAGSIFVTASAMSVTNGAQITSNSANGPAGSIALALPDNGLLRLEGGTAPGLITTSSGPGTGGTISLLNPLAVISNGGVIRALGQLGGANVRIASSYFIRSTDRSNLIEVNGATRVDSRITDVSNGTTWPTIPFLDASKVLSNQCAAARSTGDTSRMSRPEIGPYVPLGPVGPAGEKVTMGRRLDFCL